MNVLYIIGNGFDINLGLPTQYKLFYKYYCEQCLDSREHIVALKEALKDKDNDGYRWSDLEKEFGLYTEHISDYVQLADIYKDITKNLTDYIRQIDERGDQEYLASTKYREKFLKDLSEYYTCLSPAESQTLKNQLRYGHEDVNISIVTFNYTHTIENIIGEDIFGREKISSAGGKFSTYLDTNILHIHREINDNGIIWGVNDASQIKNEKLRDNPDVHTLLVKPTFNRQIGQMIDSRFKELINQANLICLFGVSLGETDQIWWKTIGDRMKQSECKVIYHMYSTDVPFNDQFRIIEQNRGKIVLLEKLGIEKELHDNFLKNVYCITSGSTFKNPDRKKTPEKYWDEIFGPEATF